MINPAQSNTTNRLLVTGGAGFIGSHLVDELLERGNNVVVLDNFDSFYDPAQKRENVAPHLHNPSYRLIEGDLRDEVALNECFSTGNIDAVIHLAAMPGVRPSVTNPVTFMDINVTGMQKLIAIMFQHGCTHLIFGSSSACYGSRSGEKFLETDPVDKPLSPYAASKTAGELIAYAAHFSLGMTVQCLRFFTVYGPRQKKEVAIQKFMRMIDHEQPITIYGDGTSRRDYVHVSDIVAGIISAVGLRSSGYEIVNLGRGEALTLIEMVHILEKAIEKKANLQFEPFKLGEMPYTHADIEKARTLLGYDPKISLEVGINRLVDWYRGQQK
jgi:UDP-glucuronate 4-epimerase